jgi:hypothetical protein
VHVFSIESLPIVLIRYQLTATFECCDLITPGGGREESVQQDGEGFSGGRKITTRVN